MGKEIGVRGAGLVVCLVLSMSVKPVWVQAQEQAQGAAQEAVQEVPEAVAEGARLEPDQEQPSAQESTEPVEQAEQSEPAEPAESVPAAEIMTLALAEQFLEAAKAHAQTAGWQISFAVVDVAGNLVAMIRMDGARWMTAQVAQAKAFTAATFRRPSAAVEEFAEQRPDLFRSLVTLIDRPLLLAGGGLPLIINGELLGGVGASGGTEDQDIDCAEAGLNAIGAE